MKNNITGEMDFEEVFEASRSWTDSCIGDGNKPDQDANSGRAKNAINALNHFAKAHGMEGESLETVMSDMLGSLNHLSDKTSMDFNEVCDKATQVYSNEAEGFNDWQ